MTASWWGKHVQTNPLKYQVASWHMPITPEPFFCLRFFQATKSALGHRGGRLSRLYLQSSNRNESFALMFNYGIYCYPLHLLMEDGDMQLIQYGVVILGLGVVAAVLFAFEKQISGKHRRRLRTISREKSQR
ncbi:TPA: hypothetical protein QH231_004889 [Klebsiella pneumoniae subsp. pneumoniae]|nr:hypothetical protein [Klebsiella pneumoniae subsp. pneumoniae]